MVLTTNSLREMGGSRQDSATALSLAEGFGADSSLSSKGGDVCCLKEIVNPEGVESALPSMALMLTVRTWAASSVSSWP